MDFLAPHDDVPVSTPWVQTYSGIAFDLMNPTPAMVSPVDIAWALARLPRFNGHTHRACNVASHSMRVMVAAVRIINVAAGDEYAFRLAALLHDAHEAYIGDIATPVASVPGMREVLVPLKRRIQAAIHRRFRIPVTLREDWANAIRLADAQVLATERRDFMGPAPREWDDLPECMPETFLADPSDADGFLATLGRVFNSMPKHRASTLGEGVQ